MGDEYIVLKGTTGQSEKACFCKPLKYKFEKQWGVHKFLYLPNSPKALLGTYLLEQLQAIVTFKEEEIILEVNDQQYIEILSLILTTTDPVEEIREEIISQVFPGVWATDVPGKAKKEPQYRSNSKRENNQLELNNTPSKRKTEKELAQ